MSVKAEWVVISLGIIAIIAEYQCTFPPTSTLLQQHCSRNANQDMLVVL
jgi:hypothetical protein